MTIDERQDTAIRHRDGPAMVLAGPGSGKTTVITHRVDYLIRARSVDPSSILVITFSRAAAREMRDRFLSLCNHRLLPVNFGTFHAVFFQILKTAYGYKASQIVREDARVGFVRDTIRRLRLETDEETDLVRTVLSEISRMKNSGETVSPVPSEANNRPRGFAAASGPSAGTAGVSPVLSPGGLEPELFRLLFTSYQEFLRQNRLLDFDDMLLFTKELFTARPDILSAWQKKFRYLLVDEFQDINPVQYEIVRMLALPENNLFIVGDDDQSIYRFRGASPEIMLHFPDDYPDAEQIYLSTNYRSVPAVVAAAGNLIAHNTARYAKDIRACSAGSIEPVYRSFATQRDQNRFVIETIRRLAREEGVPYGEMAILTRTNDQSGLLLRQLSEADLPFLSKEHAPNLYEHWIAEDLTTYVRLAVGNTSRASFLRVMNRPSRYLSRESLPFEEVSFDLWRAYYEGDQEKTEALKKLEQDLTVLSGLRPFSAVNYLRKAVGYEEYVRECARKRRLPSEELLDVLDEIQEEAKESDTLEAWLLSIEKSRKVAVARRQSGDPGTASPEEAIHIATLHASKGLEFDTVFLVDVCENIVPYKKALLPEDLEEERRLFYVGMTRAKRRLYLLSPAQIRNKAMAPSRFLAECQAADTGNRASQ